MSDHCAMTGPASRSWSPSDEERRRYVEQGWWSSVALGELVRQRAAAMSDRIAYIGGGAQLSWAQYDAAGDRLAGQFVAAGLAPGSPVAVYLPDGPWLHAVYLACERAGLVIVGIPERAGDRELAHLVARTEAAMLICMAVHRGRTAAQLTDTLAAAGSSVRLVGELDADGALLVRSHDGTTLPAAEPVSLDGRAVGPGDLWLLNSTSGTTGLPKCVRQTQNRWFYLLRIAERASRLSGADVFMSLVPGPFGFGLWSAHFAPVVFGAPCLHLDRFHADTALRAVAEHRVSVLACVTTQFQLMLSSPLIDELDLSSLRVLYTGGEAVPAERAREWERRTGSTVLQFYGSNEIGPFSCTALTDSDELRLSTVGRIVDGLEVTIYDEDGRDITATGGPGQPGGRGPGLVGGGYWNDDEANAALYGADGSLLMPDLVTIDEAGYVRIVGRKSDIIIRGGKNISAASVEADVASHPAVDMVAALPVHDAVFGERVCAVVSLRDRSGTLTLPDLVEFLTARGVSKEYFPEYLVIVDEMPQSMGAKIAKSELKARLTELLARS